MKRLAAFVLTLVCVLGLAGCFAVRKKPYKDLTAAELSSVTVYAAPPDRTVQVEDISEVTELLKGIVIYNKDDSYREYAGQAAVFTLTKTDGSQTEIVAYYPFLVIDGVGYRAEYEPCEALNAYANRLLETENAGAILEGPPA